MDERLAAQLAMAALRDDLVVRLFSAAFVLCFCLWAGWPFPAAKRIQAVSLLVAWTALMIALAVP